MMLSSPIYLAGPMTGIPQFNFPLFMRAAAMLRAEGYEVFNPAEADIARMGGDNSFFMSNATGDPRALAQCTFTLDEALADDTAFICKKARGIVFLPGWEKSSGARAEWALGVALGRPMRYLTEPEINEFTYTITTEAAE